ncbi:MAG: tRNA guanosine(34) transglycosylase Tgt [Gammaproteobacteria bacterium]|nr:tRNA guanosine(34) transglycosylase Tgt [Gammaproteobacteria bacterium]
MRFEIGAIDGAARTGTLATSHGIVRTPAFMPVGTRGTVKMVDSRDLAEAGTQMVLANTYHLMLRPGDHVVRDLGGLHAFMGWDAPILTDSGGYQIFSLDAKVTEEGVQFRSSYDGSRVELTPEDAVGVQENLGSDIAMMLDVLIGLPAPREDVQGAMERTLRWSARAVKAHEREDQALFGIVQGGTDPELRKKSAAVTATLGFDGFGIGGLSVGESEAERNHAIEVVVAELPEDRVRYMMGLGDTEGMLDSVLRGVDLFDCVWPTRLARHGKVLASTGDYSIRRAESKRSAAPLDPSCGCRTCGSYSRGYLRHLFLTGEPTGLRLLTLHNLVYTASLMGQIRESIESGAVESFRRATLEARVSARSEDSLA